jgi:hypothetical protein
MLLIQNATGNVQQVTDSTLLINIKLFYPKFANFRPARKAL